MGGVTPRSQRKLGVWVTRRRRARICIGRNGCLSLISALQQLFISVELRWARWCVFRGLCIICPPRGHPYGFQVTAAADQKPERPLLSWPRLLGHIMKSLRDQVLRQHQVVTLPCPPGEDRVGLPTGSVGRL